jgi:MFS family permease
VFTLGNSTDAFLLLRLGQVGVEARWVAVLWAAQNAVKMLAAYLGGRLSDRLGRRRLVAGGWALYAGVYFCFAAAESPAVLVAVFVAYGLYHGLTEPAEKAWVVDLAPAALKGTALGAYHGAIGLAALPASLLFGLLWKAFGPAAAFLTGAALAVAASLLLAGIPAASRDRAIA